jgi:hypothetical protein
MKPDSGENPPTHSSSTSHAFRSLHWISRPSHDARSDILVVSSCTMRLTREPPCGLMSPPWTLYHPTLLTSRHGHAPRP